MDDLGGPPLFSETSIYIPGNSSRDLFIPKRWRSPTTSERATFSPSQKGRKELPGTVFYFDDLFL